MKNTVIKLSILTLLVVVSLTTIVFAWLNTSFIYNFDAEVGTVNVVSNIYFNNNGTNIDAKEVVSITNNIKNGIYHVNISNKTDYDHIDKLRVDFKVNSNIDTYFRVRILDSITFRFINNIGETVEQINPNQGIKYKVNTNWYKSKSDNWFYFKEKVSKVNNTDNIEFLIEGLDYDLWPPNYFIQFTVIIDAVQAHLGPEKNWGLEETPWGDDW